MPLFCCFMAVVTSNRVTTPYIDNGIMYSHCDDEAFEDTYDGCTPLAVRLW